MKKYLIFIGSLFFIILFSGTNNFAQTQIDGGNVSGTWTKANSPYIINGDITIPRYETLNIEPGVEVKFNGQYRFNANGRLLAIGSMADSIRFTAIDSLAGWKGIRFIDQNGQPIQGSEIAFSVFSYGNTTVNYIHSIVDSINGGAVAIINSSNVEIRNSFFRNNSANNGGAIFVKNASPLIFNSTFIKNKSTSSTDLEVNGGGAILIKNSSAKVFNCNFNQNITSGSGNAICVTDSSSPKLQYLNIDNTMQSSPHGYAIFISATLPVTIANSKFIGNETGVWIFEDHTLAKTDTLTNLIFSNNHQSSIIINGNVLIQNSIFENNEFYVNLAQGELYLLNSVIANNNTGNHDAISVSDGTHLTVMNSIIWGNSHGFDDSWGYDYQTIDVYYSDVQGSRSSDINWGDGVVKVDPKFANSSSGNYHLTLDSPLIDAGNPDSEYNDMFGGWGTSRNDIGAYGGKYASWRSKPIADFVAEKTSGTTSTEIQFVDKSIGGNKYSWDFNNDGIFESSEQNPKFTYTEPGLYSVKLIVRDINEPFADTLIRENYISISQIHFSGDVSGVWDVDTVYVDGDITVPQDQSLTIMPGTVVYFTGTYKMHVEGQLIANGTEDNKITFTSSIEAPWQGIRFWLNNENNQPASSIAFCEFTNSLYHSGLPPFYGTIFYNNADAYISNSMFHNTSNLNFRRSGGTIYSTEFINISPNYIDSSSTLSFANCHFDSSGISIYNSSPKIDSCTIEHSYNGSDVVGIYGYNSSPVITNTIIRNNGYGGVAFSNSSPVLKFVTIENNNKPVYGGGGYFSNSNVVMTNVIVKGNSVVQSGGGLYFTAPSTGDNYTATFDNCLIVNNSVTYEYDTGGSGVIFKGKYIGNFTNCTIADNTGKTWAGVMTDGTSNAYLNNSIVWNNGNNLDFQAGGLYTYSIIQGNYVGQDTATTNHDNVDPLFRDAANGDYHLQYTGCGDGQNSPAIDAGSPAISDFVMDCSTGLGTQASDIGAYGGANNWWDRTSTTPPCYFSGDVSGVWDCDTIHVIGDILVPSGETLTITENVKRILVMGAYQIKVEGTLIARGPENGFNNLSGDYIYFSGNKWHGILFNNTNERSEATSVIENCRFDNADKMDMAYQGGGAIAIYNSDSVFVRHSVFYSNKAKYGAAMYIENSNPIIEDCYFSNNGYYTNSIQTQNGGAIFIKDSNPVLYKLQIIENKSRNGGGAIEFVNSSPLVQNILAVKNKTEGFGGAFNLSSNSSPKFVNATISNNMGLKGGAIFLNHGSNPEILNSILYADSKPEIYLGGGTPIVTYSIVDSASSESYFGIGCLDTDPKFKMTVGNYYYLSSIACSDGINSPAIDAGHPDSLDAVIDCKQGLGTNRSDMGYYGGQYSELIVGVSDKEKTQIPSKYKLAQNYPNPFNPTTTIKYSIPFNVKTQNTLPTGRQVVSRQVQLKVYNILGKEIATLVNQKQNSGTYEVNFDASNLSSGIYLYRISSGDFTDVKKMILLR